MNKEEALEALERIFDYCEEIDLHLPEGDPDRTGYNMVDDVNALRHYILFEEKKSKENQRLKRNQNISHVIDQEEANNLLVRKILGY